VVTEEPIMIENLPFVAVQILLLVSDSVVGSGSGFFYVTSVQGREQLFLATNRHVFAAPSSPTHIRLRLHADRKDLTKNDALELPLYRSRQRLWKEHPQPEVDVALLPLDSALTKQYFILAITPTAFPPPDAAVDVGEDLIVIGYPHGFHDATNNLPITRRASVASVYPQRFDGKPYFVIDAQLHPGTSGSPVMLKPTNTPRMRTAAITSFGRPVSFFFGIHSAVFLNKAGDPLGLNVVWYHWLVEEIATKGR
jgi:S1-C subfamily serine protease